MGGVIAGVLFVGVVLVDVTMLRGEAVAAKTGIRFSNGEVQEVPLTVDSVGSKYTVLVDTRDDEVALTWTILDPTGRRLYKDSELFRHKGVRRRSFKARRAGEYKVVVERRKKSRVLSAVDRDSVDVRLYVNDRRIIGPLLDWFKF